MTLVSIIIVNYNSAVMTLDSIRSLRENCTSEEIEIIVVDNASHSGDRTVLVRSQTSIDQLILSESNLGFGAANNLGAKAAHGEFILMLNPDTIVLNDCISMFLDWWKLLVTRGIGMLGCALLNPDLTDNHSAGNFSGHKPSAFLKNEFRQNVIKQIKPRGIGRLAVKKMPEDENTEPAEVDWINGACLFTRKDIFLSLGGFDERFFLFSEEVDLQRRYAASGYLRMIVPGPRIIHLHEKTRALTASTRIHFYRGYLTYCDKWNKPLTSIVTRISFSLLLVIGTCIDLFTHRYSFAENFRLLREIYR